MTTPEVDPKLFPSMERAYDFVLPSYQWLLSRVEAADNRISALLTIVSTAMFAIPVLARAIRPTVPLDSPVFLVGLALFALAAVIGISARLRGQLTLPDPAFLYRQTFESEWEFKRNAVFFAGKHLAANGKVVAEKHLAATIMSGLLLFAIVVMIEWISIS